MVSQVVYYKRQLSFEQEFKRSYGQPAAVPELNVTVPKAERKRIKPQAITILNMLRAGPVWTNELRSVAAQYGTRIKEIRELLAKDGLTVDITARGADGNNRYSIVPLAGSKYQRHLMERQCKKK